MKLSARLILLLTFSVSVVMVVASLITLRQREAALREAVRDEARVHALTLQIALEEDYLTGRSLDAQRLINRLRENTGIYSVVLFDAAGEIIAISNTLAPEEFKYLNEAREVMASGKGIEIARSISGEDYFSMILPLQVQGRRVGAIEIVQPISFVKADIARARFHIAITALLLFITILLVVTVVTRYSLARPIHELLDGAVAVGRGDLSHRVRVRVRSSGGDAMIEADPELIQQVLLNICRNGIQAMPGGGRLRIECFKDVAESDGRGFAALRVSDTGAGIAPEHLPNIFDPFFTTKEVGQGTGLGLPISIRIVEEHDGWIEAANGAEGGAVFTVYLPQASRTAEPEFAERVIA